jgi:hypothetical protein
MTLNNQLYDRHQSLHIFPMIGLRIPPLRLALLMGLFILLFMGVFALLTGYTLLEDAAARKKWTQLTGSIVRSEVIGKRAYRANIVYTYVMRETVYFDSTSLEPASFGGRNARRQKAEYESSLYHSGDTVAVYVDPADPSRSTLHRGVTWDAYARTGTGIMFILGSLIAIGWLLKHPMKLARQN